MATPACPYVTPDRAHVLQPLPVAASVRFHVDDREVPAVVWAACGACRSSVGIPIRIPE